MLELWHRILMFIVPIFYYYIVLIKKLLHTIFCLLIPITLISILYDMRKKGTLYKEIEKEIEDRMKTDDEED